jgi:hypothetical protein
MLAARSAAHIQARLTRGYPDGRCRDAAPVALGDPGQGAPQRGDPVRADRELDPRGQCGASQCTSEVAAISAQPHLAGAGRGR